MVLAGCDEGIPVAGHPSSRDPRAWLGSLSCMGTSQDCTAGVTVGGGELSGVFQMGASLCCTGGAVHIRGRLL